MTAHRIGFLIWPSTKALTLALAEEALRVAQRVHPDVVYELSFLQAEPPSDGAWQLPGEPWAGKLENFQKLFLVADEPPTALAPALSSALKQLVRAGCVIGGLSAGVYPLAQMGLLDGYRAAVHWRWQDDFAERFPKVIATSHLFDWDRDRLTACGGMSVLDLLLALLAQFGVAPRIVARQNLRLWHGVGTVMYALQWCCALAVLWRTLGDRGLAGSGPDSTPDAGTGVSSTEP